MSTIETLNGRGEAICVWMEKNCPDYKSRMERVFAEAQCHDYPDVAMKRVTMALIATAFEAGRKFQQENPTTPMDDSNAYKAL